MNRLSLLSIPGLNSYFAHSIWLIALVIPIALGVSYWVFSRRRAQRAIEFGNFSRLAGSVSATKSWLRHIPVIASLVAVCCVIIALAGPITETKVARNRATVMLIIDVSMSMSASDVQPNRFDAAKAAGREFIDSLPQDLNIGLITFAGAANVAVMPTTDHDTVSRALQGATLDEATATGDAIHTAQEAITRFSESIQGGSDGIPPATIVLLSDGKQTIPEALDDPRGAYTAADEAAKAGIPVNTISFGTQQGVIEVAGETIPVPIDDTSLMEVARRTEGQFFSANSLDKLRDIYAKLTDDIGYELKKAENPRPWLIAGFFALLTAAVSLVVDARRLPG